MVETWRKVRNEAVIEDRKILDKIEVTSKYSDGPKSY
jgi:hypothetical protein